MYLKEKVFLICCSLILISCGNDEPQDPRDLFFTTLSAYCDDTFTGEGVYPDDPDHDLIDTVLRAHLSSCDENIIAIDLYRNGGETWHATWILEKREDGLHLYHDHAGDRDEEELEDVLTGYGGYADQRGTATQQFFPADDHTAEILPEAATNVWMMELMEDTGQFNYYLERHAEPRFRAELTLN
jgi:hypothetical protein